MRTLFIIIFSILCLKVVAQPLNNEWIDYSKTYYKFKVGKTGIYRLSLNALTAINIQNTPVEQFQLWRNGKQIPLFTTKPTGVMNSTDYIEFWGEQNDGQTDRFLYRDPSFQLSDKISLQTDTAAFFLTINPIISSNLRFTTVANNVAGNTLPVEPYFIHQYRIDFRDNLNRGFAQNVGENVYSSSYDIGEFFSSNEIRLTNSPFTVNAGNLFVANGAPSASVQIGMAANAAKARSFELSANNSVLLTQQMNGFTAGNYSNNNVPISVFNNTSESFRLRIVTTDSFDRIVCSYINLQYPRQFNFGGANNFKFSIPANTTGKFLNITNFNSGNGLPILYDITTLKRYVANVANNGTLQFALPPSSENIEYILVSQDVTNITAINSLQQKTFINYAAANYHADYLIITNQLLTNNSTAVEDYRAYRSSIAGGNFTAKVYDIDELVDQFAYGIKKHPLSIKNFIRFARQNFTSKQPAFVFLIGKATTYEDYRRRESSPFADRLNLVPTWGWPASDILLVSSSLAPVPSVAVGRLSAITPQEVAVYLDKVKDFDLQAINTNQTIASKAWMKQMVHVAGANDANLDALLTGYLRGYENIAKDTLIGATVNNFGKSTTGAVTTITNAEMENLFASGISLLSYFGHSAASALDYNLNDPSVYNNTGKYPFFLVNGCSAGNFFDFDESRFSVTTALAEKFVLAPKKGAIGFIASTHFGLTTYLDTYSSGFYRSASRSTGYGKTISKNMADAIATLQNSSGNFSDYFARQHAEQTILHGDPALKIYSSDKPDFVIEAPQVIVSPTILSVADNQFTVKTRIYNIGKATGDSLMVSIKRQYPDGSMVNLFSRRIKSVRFVDSISINVPIIATRDRGTNNIIVQIDDDGKYDEMSESNNIVSKSFVIFDDELRPVFPYNFSIINQSTSKLIASTANPLSTTKNYLLELDTTALFNSPFKISRNVASVGGVVEFDPAITFTDSTVYYWRVAQVASNGPTRFNESSFMYTSKSLETGFGQSHLYQHFKSNTSRISLDSNSRRWKFGNNQSLLQITHSIFPYYREPVNFQITVNGQIITQSACIGNSIIFNVFDPVTLKPFFNQTNPSMIGNGGTYGGFMGSAMSCASVGSAYNFEFSYLDVANRNKIRDFMNWIPNGAVVTARLIFDNSPVGFVNDWKNDGTSNTMYHLLKQAGFSDIDSFNVPRTWSFIYTKNNPSFTPISKFTNGLFDNILINAIITNTDTLGYIYSPTFGPATSWKQLQWRGSSLDNSNGDIPQIDVFGVNTSGQETKLLTVLANNQNVDISGINATNYPYLKLAMKNQDSIHFTPYQLRYWRLTGNMVSEGALSPNILYNIKDTLEAGEPLSIAIAFKNVSNTTFSDSLDVKLQVVNQSNVTNTFSVNKLKKIAANDTATIRTLIDTKAFSGNNTLFIDVNPSNNPIEQHRFNNFLYKNFFVKVDDKKPLLDVTFDGVHILNNDIVSSKPAIRIELKDESTFQLLNDTSLVTVQLRYPNFTTRRFRFNNDTLRFTAATTTNNKAIVDFSPYLQQDGDYELIVTGKDKSDNAAATQEYRIAFKVYNKPMISNVFNYPNPFTTSTAFAFTLTGSEVPQNIKIQILTVTGKIVREITKSELGPIRIGNNITEFKWDGTDMFGAKLANGVYLYRVITNLNGNTLDKFKTTDRNGGNVDTDKYFKAGYGKMYLMR